MFEVLWTDPSLELVGERKVRKEQEAKAKSKEKKNASGRQSAATTTSSSSSERGLGFFSSRSRRRPPARLTDLSMPQNMPNSGDGNCHRGSIDGVSSILSHQDDSQITMKPSEPPALTVQIPECTEMTSSPSSQESETSRWTRRSAGTTGTWAGMSLRDSTFTEKSEHLVQALGNSSFVTQRTEITASPRSDGTSIEDILKDEVQISSESVKADAETCSSSRPPEETNAVSFEDFDCPTSPPLGPLTPPLAEAGWMSNDAWKPPQEWACTPTKSSRHTSFDGMMCTSPVSPVQGHYITPDLQAVQREVRMMLTANHDLILANIQSNMGGNSPDAMVYKELEMTKKRWMFSFLHNEGCYADFHIDHHCAEGTNFTRTPRILSLYETQASASFYAALYPDLPHSHLSQTPLSPSLFKNVQPILVPSVSASAGSRSVPPRFYAAVTCLSLPTLFQATDIPCVLRSIHRCLIPGGALYMTLIDPEPIFHTMGPKLRQWLLENLLINLESAFRTTCPSKTVPAWLGVARLRGKGSTIGTVQRPAVSPDDDKESILRCEIVRMLWQEVWGPYVHAQQWWWDDDEIIQECREMGTIWQYSHVACFREPLRQKGES